MEGITLKVLSAVEADKNLVVVTVEDRPQPVYALNGAEWKKVQEKFAAGASVADVTLTQCKEFVFISQVGETGIGSKNARSSKGPKFVTQYQRRLAREGSSDKQKEAKGGESSNDIFGVRPLVEEKVTAENKRTYTKIKDLNKSLVGKEVWIRARVHNTRNVSAKLYFATLRDQLFTVQTVLAENKEFIKFVRTKVTKESVVDIYGKVTGVEFPVESVTQQDVEIAVSKLFVVSFAKAELPIDIETAARPEWLVDQRAKEISELEQTIKETEEKLAAANEGKESLQAELDELLKKKKVLKPYNKVGKDTRLDNRVLDLRTPANQAIFRIQSGVCRLFREYLSSQGFTEIHSPKLLGAASEGDGAQVFKCEYFEQYGIPFAYLAQSPQLYKQMVLAGDMDRVFEVGPVFRRENSQTARHLTEFTGFDLEMALKQHYHEALEVLGGMFIHLFKGLEKEYAAELKAVGEQYPFEPLEYREPTLILQWPEAIPMLQAELRKPVEETVDPVLVGELLQDLAKENPPKTNVEDLEDLSTKAEKLLGKLVKQKYNTDFYVLDKFPAHIRPFYTMPDPHDERYSNSYDLFLRGQEICSGAQRIHEPELLSKRATAKGVPLETIASYIESFTFGAPPHAGGGIGLERVVFLFLGLDDIRKSSLFPRDPRRLTP
ncbi:Aspartate--tRNA ligase, cytoplasmic [Balamuthia mandrillaris]